MSHLKVQNFKSFSNIDIKLGKFNVIIGANASGKSNFIQIFNFLKDIKELGLDNAVSLQGGIEHVCNFNEFDKNLMIELDIALPSPMPIRIFCKKSNPYKLQYKNAKWKFELESGKESGHKIINDNWEFKINISKKGNVDSKLKSFEDTIQITRKNKYFQINTSLPDDTISINDIYPDVLINDIPNESLLIESHYYGIDYLFPQIADFFSKMVVYDFDSKLAKQPSSPKGKIELESNGSNLAIILKSIIKDQEKKREFTNLITDLLPFMKSIDTENFADKSIMFTLTENYFKNHPLPSPLISDGTSNIIALIIALYFQQNDLTIIKEPERNIHPFLISKVIDMMKETSSDHQIFVTTHNPEIVKYSELSNLFTVKRNKKGFSEIIRPLDQEEIKMFLDNEMNVEDLYVQNILSG